MGDVGGFNDGLFLVMEIFMATYAALAFKVDYLSNLSVERLSRQVLQNSKKYKDTLDKI